LRLGISRFRDIDICRPDGIPTPIVGSVHWVTEL